MKHRPILILQTGTPPTEIRNKYNDIPTWFGQVLNKTERPVSVVRVFEGDNLPAPNADYVTVITGSWAMVTDRLPWSEATAQWIRDAVKIEAPLFGVCYGHQLMAHALGGRVDYHPKGPELGCQTIQLQSSAAQDPLLAALPSQFQAHLSHEQSVIEPPAGASVLAGSAHDPHQIIRYGQHAVSTQFHPEFTPGIAGSLLQRRLAASKQDGAHIETLLANLVETPDATSILSRFVESYEPL